MRGSTAWCFVGYAVILVSALPKPSPSASTFATIAPAFNPSTAVSASSSASASKVTIRLPYDFPTQTPQADSPTSPGSGGDGECEPPFETLCDPSGNYCRCLSKPDVEPRAILDPNTTQYLIDPRAIIDPDTTQYMSDVAGTCPRNTVKICNKNVQPTHCQCLFTKVDGCSSGTERLCDPNQEQCGCFSPNLVARSAPGAGISRKIGVYASCDANLETKLCNNVIDPTHCQCVTKDDGCAQGTQQLCGNDRLGVKFCLCLSPSDPIDLHETCGGDTEKVCDINYQYCQCAPSSKIDQTASDSMKRKRALDATTMEERSDLDSTMKHSPDLGSREIHTFQWDSTKQDILDSNSVVERSPNSSSILARGELCYKSRYCALERVLLCVPGTAPPALGGGLTALTDCSCQRCDAQYVSRQTKCPEFQTLLCHTDFEHPESETDSCHCFSHDFKKPEPVKEEGPALLPRTDKMSDEAVNNDFDATRYSSPCKGGISIYRYENDWTVKPDRPNNDDGSECPTGTTLEINFAKLDGDGRCLCRLTTFKNFGIRPLLDDPNRDREMAVMKPNNRVGEDGFSWGTYNDVVPIMPEWSESDPAGATILAFHGITPPLRPFWERPFAKRDLVPSVTYDISNNLASGKRYPPPSATDHIPNNLANGKRDLASSITDDVSNDLAHWKRDLVSSVNDDITNDRLGVEAPSRTTDSSSPRSTEPTRTLSKRDPRPPWLSWIPHRPTWFPHLPIQPTDAPMPEKAAHPYETRKPKTAEEARRRDYKYKVQFLDCVRRKNVPTCKAEWATYTAQKAAFATCVDQSGFKTCWDGYLERLERCAWTHGHDWCKERLYSDTGFKGDGFGVCGQVPMLYDCGRGNLLPKDQQTPEYEAGYIMPLPYFMKGYFKEEEAAELEDLRVAKEMEEEKKLSNVPGSDNPDFNPDYYKNSEHREDLSKEDINIDMNDDPHKKRSIGEDYDDTFPPPKRSFGEFWEELRDNQQIDGTVADKGTSSTASLVDPEESTSQDLGGMSDHQKRSIGEDYDDTFPPPKRSISDTQDDETSDEGKRSIGEDYDDTFPPPERSVSEDHEEIRVLQNDERLIDGEGRIAKREWFHSPPWMKQLVKAKLARQRECLRRGGIWSLHFDCTLSERLCLKGGRMWNANRKTCHDTPPVPEYIEPLKPVVKPDMSPAKKACYASRGFWSEETKTCTPKEQPKVLDDTSFNGHAPPDGALLPGMVAKPLSRVMRRERAHGTHRCDKVDHNSRCIEWSKNICHVPGTGHGQMWC